MISWSQQKPPSAFGKTVEGSTAFHEPLAPLLSDHAAK
jgi:hypothetical protein